MICPASSGFACNIFWQTWKPKGEVVNRINLGQMGFGLPSAIGAYYATGKRVILLEGDGGFQMNSRELQLVADLPICIFVINNNGYASIRSTQSRYFGRLYGADSSSGMTLPNLENIAKCYYLPYWKVYELDHFEDLFELEPPYICEVFANPNQQYKYKASYHMENGVVSVIPIEHKE